MTAVSAQDAVSSSDCVQPYCVLEAAPRSDYCRAHLSMEGQRMDCKIEGCDEEAVDRAGPYGRLCATHKAEAREARIAAPPPPPLRSTSSLAEEARKLLPLARSLDRARAKLAATPSTQRAKIAFDEATRRASATPTPENLDRVVEATRQLQQGAPKRIRLENEVSSAERALGLAVQSFAQAARAT